MAIAVRCRWRRSMGIVAKTQKEKTDMALFWPITRNGGNSFSFARVLNITKAFQ
jgi:hypothetical protein